MQHQHSHSRTRDSRTRDSRRGGFTLVEIIVVLVIATILSSVLFAAFRSVSEGNKKSSCQNNLVQIYQGLRQYGQDNEGLFPSYNPNGAVEGTTADPRPAAGLGLWSLYVYPASAALDCDGRTTQLPLTEAPDNQTPPLASYIKSPRFFHCPYDDFERDAVVSPGCNVEADTKLNSSILEFTDKAGQERFNPFYNSYQTTQDLPTSDADALNNSPYSSFRTEKARRQLVYYQSKDVPSLINPERRTPDTTIVTWCRFHRKIDRDGATVTRADNSDNVLFMDGTVQYLPTTQTIGSEDCTDWKRAPLATVGSLAECPK